jgi:hypothetical protein
MTALIAVSLPSLLTCGIAVDGFEARVPVYYLLGMVPVANPVLN